MPYLTTYQKIFFKIQTELPCFLLSCHHGWSAQTGSNLVRCLMMHIQISATRLSS